MTSTNNPTITSCAEYVKKNLQNVCLTNEHRQSFLKPDCSWNNNSNNNNTQNSSCLSKLSYWS